MLINENHDQFSCENLTYSYVMPIYLTIQLMLKKYQTTTFTFFCHWRKLMRDYLKINVLQAFWFFVVDHMYLLLQTQPKHRNFITNHNIEVQYRAFFTVSIFISQFQKGNWINKHIISTNVIFYSKSICIISRIDENIYFGTGHFVLSKPI